jgi:hypothetical protein
MNIQYVDPLSRGFGRMKKALFQPFDLRTWLVVGFTAFLAGLTDYHGGNRSNVEEKVHVDWEEVFTFPHTAWTWLADNPFWATLIAVGVFVLLILLVLLTWLSARGKFMFLDNVVHRRAQVSAPWNGFKTEGNSLFLWNLGLGLLALVTVLAYVGACSLSLYGMHEHAAGWRILLVISFIELLLNDFVVPIMYKNRWTAGKAVRVFWSLFTAHVLQFFAYGLLVLLLNFLLVIGIATVGLLTCCIGFIILIIPYVNSVVLLPVSYTLRAFSVEFLEQYGPAYRIFPKTAVDRAAPQPKKTRA